MKKIVKERPSIVLSIIFIKQFGNKVFAQFEYFSTFDEKNQVKFLFNFR